jgi:hypothetical protein
VALIDRKTFPRDKLCGGLITGRARRHYAEIFGHDMPFDPQDRKTTVDFRYRGQPVGIIEDAPALCATMRWDMDAMLCAHAMGAGAQDFTGQASALGSRSRRVARISTPPRRYGLIWLRRNGAMAGSSPSVARPRWAWVGCSARTPK